MLLTLPRAIGLAFLAWFTTLTSGARAWGPLGHEAVAHLAERHLTPAARVRVAELLGPGASLASVASWADDVRGERPETRNWHFIDIPNDARTRRPDVARFCPKHDCVVEQIELARRRIEDTTLPAAVRAEALKFLVHFVGDLHQPLHCADDGDRGGNDKSLKAPGSARGRMKLHAFWDNLLSSEPRGDAQALATQLEQRISERDRAAWQRGTTADWAWEGYLIARRVIYADFRRGPTRKPVPLPARYRGKEPRRVVERQLARAGIRLAWLLNSAFRS